MSHYNDLNVFLVENDTVCAELYKQYLRNMGITRISLFEKGEECLKMIGNKPDIVLLAHQTKPTSGHDIIKMIKRLDSDIYVIYVLESKDMKEVVDALKCGAFNCMVKGYNEEELLTNIIKYVVGVRELAKKGIPTDNSKQDTDKYL